MHKYKFFGFKNTVLGFVTSKTVSLRELWENQLLPLIQDYHNQDQSLLSLDLDFLLHMGCCYVNQKRLHKIEELTTDISDNTFIRIHLSPKRYFYSWMELPKLIVFENEEVIVLCKPSGMPVHPTVDNWSENVLSQLTLSLGIPLFGTHRLDQETEGLLLIAKSQLVQAAVNDSFQKRQLKKYYKAIISKNSQGDELSLGLKRHWMVNSKQAPKKLTEKEDLNHKLCELTITHKELLSANYQGIDIELGTGRTHQIRAQLSHLRFPIVGDIIYGGALDERLWLQSNCIEFINPGDGRSIKIKHPQNLFEQFQQGDKLKKKLK
ncbi:MAG: RluA family pseudouridine synthase [Bdellovibrionaceae bacterium]|nr:RluA family pseudouridine synthase [Pseudobdellovibrionaceae bacterium]NUM58036.1 RluA family pseudouridine synthase [Pseudobdellovibrionaceae bacterium]